MTETERIYFGRHGEEYLSKEDAIKAEEGRLRTMGFENPMVFRIAYREKCKTATVKNECSRKELAKSLLVLCGPASVVIAVCAMAFTNIWLLIPAAVLTFLAFLSVEI